MTSPVRQRQAVEQVRVMPISVRAKAGTIHGHFKSCCTGFGKSAFHIIYQQANMVYSISMLLHKIAIDVLPCNRLYQSGSSPCSLKPDACSNPPVCRDRSSSLAMVCHKCKTTMDQHRTSLSIVSLLHPGLSPQWQSGQCHC